MPDLVFDKNELHFHWAKVLESAHWTEGHYVRAFEDAVSEWSGMHAVAVSNAGSGLFAIMRCLSGPTEDVLVQNNTFFATGAMVREAGYRPVLVDVKKDDFSMSMLSMTEFMSPSVRAIVLTHVGGALASDYMAISRFCNEFGIPLIEDAAHVLGVGEGLKMTCAGSLGHAAVFSLYPTKAIPAGEGGVIITRDAYFAEKLRKFRNYGKSVKDGVVQYTGEGFNFRMDEFTAVVAYLQMTHRKRILETRAEAAHKLSQIIPPLYPRPGSPTNWYKYIVSAGFPAKKQTGKVYGLSDQLHTVLGTPDRALFLPVSKWVAENHICLPVEPARYAHMSVSQLTDYLMRP